MMNQLLEFAINHWELVSLFALLLLLAVWMETRNGVQGLTPAEVTNLINKDEAVVVDIRPAAEFRTGHITSALNIPAATLKDHLGTLEKHKESAVVLVCKSGMTAGASAKELEKNGFAKVYKMKGGIAEWQGASLPLVTK